MLLGVVKDVVLTYLGFMFFNDAFVTGPVIAGLALSFLGAGYYSFDQYSKT